LRDMSMEFGNIARVSYSQREIEIFAGDVYT